MAELSANEKRIIKAYTKPGHPIAFSAPRRVAKYFNISETKAKKILQHIEGYTLHREYKQPRVYNPYYVRHRREQIQGDLIDTSKIKEHNNGICFLLVLIDIFTKFLWVFPLKNKRATTLKETLSRWIRNLDVKPKILMTDRGSEFVNNQVKTLLQNNNIILQEAYGTLKACIAERVNKTLQILIYKYLTEKETLTYIDVLQDLVNSYNKRGHRTLKGISPKNADLPENEDRIQQIFNQKYGEIANRRKTPKYKVGDRVRVKTDPGKISSAARAYAEQFNGEYFRIVRINRTLPIPLYYLRSMNDEQYIKGGFYAEELELVRGDVYKIERIIRRKRRRNRNYILVKWKYFNDNWNEWIPEDSIVQAYPNGRNRRE